MTKKTIGVFVGSLRRDSFSKKVARHVMALMADKFEMRMLEIGDLPIYNQDTDEGEVPAQWSAFRAQVKALDGFLFVTPEYNRSVPAVLKNALDVASRPYGQSAWESKPGAIISVSPGAMGGFGANHHLRQSMVFLNVFMMQQPEAYINNAAAIFNENGEILENTGKFLQKWADGFAAWVNRF